MDAILPLLQGNTALMTLGLLWLIGRDALKVWRTSKPVPTAPEGPTLVQLESEVVHIKESLVRIETLIERAVEDNTKAIDDLVDKVQDTQLRLVRLEAGNN